MILFNYLGEYEMIEEILKNSFNVEEKYELLEEDRTQDILTTLVRIKGSNHTVVPVKSNKPLDKKIWIECSKALSRIYVGSPINQGDIICKNILNTGVDIVCTKNMNRCCK